MYIRRVTIHNVRGFKEVDLDLTRPNGSFAGWTVLAGRNGSGKSSLLRLLAYAAIDPPEAIFRLTNVREWLRKGTRRGLASIEKLGDDVTVTRTLSLLQGAVGFEDSIDLPEGERKGFLAAYGPYRRLTGYALGAESLMAGSDSVARVVTLFREDASLIESVTWLREVYLRKLENRSGAEDLQKNVLALLNDGLLPDGVFIQSIDSDAIWITQHGAQLPLTELSDGYRTTTALIMDIVHHLHKYHDTLDVDEAQDERGRFLRILHNGVVLIDEVDLHLHPSWQKRIGFWLKRHFPNIQFIVTTHSPFVCQAADPKGLIRLPAPGENRPAEHVSEDLYNTVVNGSLDEAVLTDLFGLESPYSDQTEKLRERVAELEARLQAGEATPGEEEEFDQLSAQLPQTLPTAVEQALRKLAADV